MWASLLTRIRKDHPKFRTLGFKYLRKTAAQFVQSVGGDLVAGVFLFHGAKVRADDLLDKYTNRDWAAVYRGNAAVRQMLQPVFDQCPEPFQSGKRKGGGNISLGKIERIQQLHRDGVHPDEIAQIVKVSRATVYRRIQGTADASRDAAPTENTAASAD